MTEAAANLDRRARQRLATARWRARHPEREREAQRRQDERPERKERQKLRARAKRATPEHKAAVREYRKRPEVKAREAASDTRKAFLRDWRGRPEQKAKRAAYMRAKRQDPVGRLENRMRAGVRRALTSGRLPARWRDLVGYDGAALRDHIERQFLPGMSWDNAAEWHIDHIVPLSKFAIVEAGDAEFRAAWALTNLRPLWSWQNLKKGARVEVLL